MLESRDLRTFAAFLMPRGSLALDRVVTALALAGMLLALRASPTAQADLQTKALQTFQDRVKGYVDLRTQLEQQLPQPAIGDSEAVEAHQKAIVQAIQQARAKAKPGDLFSPFVADALRSIIKTEFRNRPREDFYDMLEDIPKAVRIDVNQPYPAGAPHATMPPLLIGKLPPLPPEVAYAFIGRALILRDVEADLIVDLAPNALPRRP